MSNHRRLARTLLQTGAFRSIVPFCLLLALAQGLGATTFTVSNTNDAGAGSLRQAIIDANGNGSATAGSPHIINATGVSGTISLATALDNLNNHITINGPGARTLNVARSAAGGTPEFRIFVVPFGRTVRINGMTISNGRLAGFGGGIFSDGTLTVTECTISGNTITGFNSGGGIFSGGTLVLERSTISGNAGDFGAGIALYAPGTSTITNCTISGNASAASTGGVGGGILIGFSPVSASIVNSTIANNTIANSNGGGIGLASGDASQTLNYRNTIISGNTSSQVGIFSGAVTSLGYNICSDFTGNLTASGDHPNTNALLGPLADNGGPTNTQAPQPTSPAIDGGGAVVGLANDQRGANYPRVQDLNAFANATGGNGSDIGAVEIRRFIVNITGDGSDATSIGDGLADTDLGTAGDQTSLRSAIQESNADVDFNVIEFAIPTAGTVQTISVGSGLPVVSRVLYIDGWSQGGAGYDGTPKIEIDGAATLTTFGLNIQASGSTVRGLAITGFPTGGVGNGVGIGVFGATTGVWIYGNHLGVDPSGAIDDGNGQFGIWLGLGADGTLIGTNGDGVGDASERNVISGNVSDGIRIQSSGNVVAGNYIGTNAAGTAAIANVRGIHITAASGNVIGGNATGTGNLISGNLGGGGILLNTSVTGTVITGNRIGTDVTGTLDLGNGYTGVYLGVAVSGTRIGTDGDGVGDALERNIISGNVNDGITAGFIGSAEPSSSVIAGNYIGTDVTGTAAIPNDDSGIYLTGSGHRVGTNADGVNDAAERNVLSGNTQTGITLLVATVSSSSNVVAGNYIGTSSDGVSALGNGIAGVRLLTGVANNTIGGTSAAAANVIANNGGGAIAGTKAGVLIVAAGVGNRVIGNSIHTNIGIGIDIDGNGVTPNDASDPDEGPNRRQNYPELTDAKFVAGGSIVLAYSVPSAIASSSYPLSIELFLSDGSGEGRTLVGTLSYAAPGAASATVTPSSPVGVGDKLVATATDAAGNTSEFSAEMIVTPTITSQPQSLSLCAPSPAVFTVAADGDGLTYQWRRNGVPLVEGGNVSGSTTAMLTIAPTSSADNGLYDVIVSGSQSDPASLYVDDPPVLTVPADVAIACDESSDPANTGTATAVDAEGPPVIDYTDEITAGSCASAYTITRTWTATDACRTVSGVQTISVQDVNGPAITTSSTAIGLWPVDHTYRTVTVASMVASVADNCSDLTVADVVITRVTSDEPEDANGNGDGQTIDDMVIASDCRSVDLRAERAGSGNGRVYRVYLMLTDDCGNVATASFAVTVPISQSGTAAVEGAAVYCEAGSCGSCSALKPVAGESIAHSATLEQNMPNPFTVQTSIDFRIAQDQHVTLGVYTLDGREVVTLVDDRLGAGTHTVSWNGQSVDGQPVASGVYLYRLDIQGSVLTRRMMLAR
jgi:hypothetical protein